MPNALFCAVPHLLVAFRVTISIGILLLGPTDIGVPALYSLALISDLLDGFYYRHYTAKAPNHVQPTILGISPDPLGDLCFILGGLAFWCFYGWHSLGLAIGIDLAMGILTLGFSIAIARTTTQPRLHRALCTSFYLTAYGVMLVALAGVWSVFKSGLSWLPYFAATMFIFYVIYFAVEDKTRRIRG